ncbi:DUF1327 domain-containing protein [Escherichia coli]|uniref:DUF1327 domain-containing protein n=1 Tax=Escherichia coli TaxID=562 RepID=UPI0010224192|nr:DUF1327 domain-containing protein [Escherichia coli]
MNKQYELVVKGINNYPDKITVTVALDFMDVAAGLCEGNEPLPEKRPVILEAQDVLITYRGKLPGIITGSLKTPPLA